MPSTKEDDTVRYHSLHDNMYLQYFKGHKGRVVSLEASPVDVGFVSGSMDKTARVWDLRSPACRGLLNYHPCLSRRMTQPVLSLPSPSNTTLVYCFMIKQTLTGRLTLEDPTPARPPRPIYMTSMSFSSNGKYLLVGCFGDAHYAVDAICLQNLKVISAWDVDQ